MVFRYYAATDMLYIKLGEGLSHVSAEVAPGLVLDFDENNRLVGLEIAAASKSVDLNHLEFRSMPIANLIFSE